jgi:hypothetical protein
MMRPLDTESRMVNCAALLRAKSAADVWTPAQSGSVLYWIKTDYRAARCAAVACGDMVMKGMAKVNGYSKVFRLDRPQKKGDAP